MQTERRRPEADKATENAAATSESAGWIEWSGGECPVDRFTKVHVRLRSGHTNEREAAYFEWIHGRGPFGYEHDDDVVSYRIVGAAA